MKGNKALYKTKDCLSTNINLKDVNGLNQVYGNTNDHITNLKRNQNANKDFDLQSENVCSHVTCTCGDKHREISYYNTSLSQAQSKNYNDVGVGSVKKLKRQKVKKLDIPITQERAVGTLDVPILKSDSENFNDIETLIKTDKSKGSSYKRLFLDKKLSPFFKTKSINANSNAISLRNNKGSLHYKSCKDKFVNATTQLNNKELINKTGKVKIFKEFAVNTGSVVNLNLKKSETETSLDLSTVLNNKNLSHVNSLDSLMQHVYSLDKQRFEDNLSRILIDPMENILEREYRKIFSVQSRDCLCTKDSAINFLPRRFEDLRGSGSRHVLLNYISETSSHLTEPSCIDVSVISEQPSFNSLSKNIENNSNIFPNDISEKGLVEGQPTKKNTDTGMKTKKSSKWRQFAAEEGDNRGMKRIFRLWGKKQSAEGDFNKKSKLKCCLNKRSERSVKTTKLSNNKSVDMKERNKFRIFKKRDKECTIELKPKKVVTSGRCEIRQELILKIGKSYSKQDDQLKFVGSMRRRSMYQSLINARDSIANYSNNMNKLLYDINSTANTMSLLQKGSLTDFSRQCIQAWIIPNIILDKFIKAKVKCNLKCEKYRKNCDSAEPYVTTTSKPKTSMATNKTIFTCNTCTEKKHKPQSKCIMFDIALSCSSEYDNNSYISKESDEKVYNIVNYETSFPNSVGSTKIDYKPNFNKKTSILDTDKHNEEAERIKQIDKQVLAKAERLDKSILFNNMSIQNTQKIMGVETVTQRISKHLGYDPTNIETFYPTDINNLKFTEIYLRKLFHDWIPNQIDSKCISNLNFQRNLLGSLHNVKVKNGNLKSYPTTTDGVRFTTLLSSCNAAGKIGQENKTHDEIINCTKIHKQKRDTSKTNAAVRILPKDSLEVFKRRKLYLNSNRTKWKCGNELLISVSSFIEPLNGKSPKSVKIHHSPITILENNVDNALKNKELMLSKEVQTDSDCKKIEQGNKIKEKSCNKDESEKNKLLIKKCNCSKSQIEEFNLTGSRPIKENFFLPPQNSNLKDTESNIPNDKKEIKSVSKDGISKDIPKCAQKDKSFNIILNETHNHKTTEIKACQSTKQIKSLFKMPTFTKIRKQFLVDKKYSNEFLDSVKKGTKRWSNITDMLRISPLAQTFARSDTASSRQNCFTTTKSRSKLLGFHFKKRPVVKNASKSCSTADHIYCECGSIGVDNETNCDIKRNNKNYVNTLNECIEQTTNTPCNLHEQVPHVCNKRNESKNNLIEINLKVNPTHGEDKNIVISINDTNKISTKEEINEGVQCPRQNKNFAQNKSGQSLRDKTSNFFLNIKVHIKNCKKHEGLKKKKSKTNKKSKRISQKQTSTSSELSKSFNNNPCSVHKCTVDLTNSVVNDNESYEYNEDFTVLKLQNKDISNNNEEVIERMNDDDTVLESVCKNYNKKFVNNYSIIKRGGVSNGQDEKIEKYNLNPKPNTVISEIFMSSKTDFKPSAHLSFYNKILPHYKMHKKEVKVKKEEGHSSAQQTIQNIFKCKKDIKEITKLRTIKEPTNLLKNVTSCHLSDQEDTTNHNGRLIYEALKSNLSSFKTDRLHHFDSMLYSNKRNNVKFQNYYCNTVPQASKRHNARITILKSESCLCNVTVQNSGQDLKKSYKPENCNILSSNINNDGDGSPFKLILPLIPDCTDSFHQSNDEPEASPVEVKCKLKEINAKEKRDIFELEEIKNAVLEMYITEKFEYDSDIFSTMPEVVSEVEDVMILKTQP